MNLIHVHTKLSLVAMEDLIYMKDLFQCKLYDSLDTVGYINLSSILISWYIQFELLKI